MKEIIMLYWDNNKFYIIHGTLRKHKLKNFGKEMLSLKSLFKSLDILLNLNPPKNVFQIVVGQFSSFVPC